MLATSVKSTAHAIALLTTRFRALTLLFAAVLALGCLPSLALAASVPEIDEPEPVPASDPRWDALRAQLFNKKEILETDGVISLDAPRRAFDSARVPAVSYTHLTLPTKA